MRQRARTDSTQAAIVAALRQAGATVHDTSKVGGGFPDIIAGRVMPCPFCQAHTPRNVLIECKAGRGKLNKLQEEFHASWRGPITVVKTVEEALVAVGLADGRDAVLAALGEGEQ
jgi:hypothetical protein